MSGLTTISLSVAPDVAGKVVLGLVQAAPVRVGPAGAELDAAMSALAAEQGARHAGQQPSEIGGLQAARDLYKSFGIDPTKTRPSSEALLRRVLKGDALPRVLSAVDVGNLCSVRFLLPLGLYDVGKIRGAVTLRRGRAGESYPGIRKDQVNLEGRPTLADDEGAFGNPTSDSFRTSVDAGTRSLWMVVFAPRGYSRERMAGHVASAREAMATHLAGDSVVDTAGEVLGGEGSRPQSW